MKQDQEKNYTHARTHNILATKVNQKGKSKQNHIFPYSTIFEKRNLFAEASS